MFKKKQSDQLWVEMINELKELRYDNETLKRENAELRETNNKLKHSLDESVRSNTRPQRAPTADSRPSTDSELQRQLNRKIQQLSETRQQLLSVQERLTVAEQVTAATKRRELQQECVCENLPSDSDYQELRFDAAQEHLYTHAGCIIVSRLIVRNFHRNILHYSRVRQSCHT